MASPAFELWYGKFADLASCLSRQEAMRMAFDAGVSMRRDAMEKGLKYEGDPCKGCGNTVRYVRGGSCVICSADGRLRRKK